jgi:hypothetical protein
LGGACALAAELRDSAEITSRDKIRFTSILR